MSELCFFLFIQIVVESLPISSSGHVLLFKNIFVLNFNDQVYRVLDYLAHGPTACIIAIFFFKEWGSLFFRLIKFQTQRASYKKLASLFFKIAGFVFITDFITAIFFVVLKKGLLKKLLFSTSQGLIIESYVTILGMVVTAVGLLSLRWLSQGEATIAQLKGGVSDEKVLLEGKSAVAGEDGVSGEGGLESVCQGGRPNYGILTWRRAAIIGLVQGFSLLPGISRFGATYIAGRWLKLSPRRAFEYSFLIHFPLIVAAFLFEGVLKWGRLTRDLEPTSPVISLFYSPQTWIVVILATILGYAAFCIAYRWALEKKLWRLGFYMFLPALLLLISLIASSTPGVA